MADNIRQYVFDVYKDAKTYTTDEILSKTDLDVDYLDLSYSSYLSFGGDKKMYYTNEEHPYTTFNLLSSGLYINGSVLKSAEGITTLKKIIKQNNISTIHISNDVYTEELLSIICSIPEITGLNIGEYNENHDLTVEEYQKIKACGHIKKVKTSGVCKELEDNYDDLISFNADRQLISYYTYSELQNLAEITLGKNFKEESKYLKFLNPNTIIKIRNTFASTSLSIEAIQILAENNTKNPIEIDIIEDKNEIGRYLLSNPLAQNLNAIINFETRKYPLKTFLEYEQKLFDLVAPAQSLSPLEKYLYAYNVVKKFKQYKESDNRSEARNVYDILDNEYMVCVGFSKLLQDLLAKLDINSRTYGISVDTSFDNIASNYEGPIDVDYQSPAGHSRLEVNLVDPKYGINGIYIADPTWDNVMSKDCYNYALMTQDDYNTINRYNYLTFYNVNELFFVHDLDEFYAKVNVWLNKKNSKQTKLILEQIKKYKDEIKKVESSDDPNWKEKLTSIKNNLDYKQKEFKNLTNKTYIELINNINNNIQEIDPFTCAQINEKFPWIKSSYTQKIEFPKLQEYLLFVGEYIVEKANKRINGNVLKDAIKEIYKTCYHTEEESLDDTINEIFTYNQRRHEICFPVRYRIKQDGTKEPILEHYNPFELEQLEDNVALN